MTRPLLLTAVLLAAAPVAAGELSSDAKSYLDAECRKAALERKTAPCAGVANATLFAMMMSPKHKEEATRPELGDAIKAHCTKVCEAARK